MNNDAGGITTYSVAGAHFGFKLLWVFIPMTLALIVVQEMSARMGAITGKGLADQRDTAHSLTKAVSCVM
ncbi:Natural resistance-associated macrophage protein [Acididesulfobacillus acetoxydans]|uniref:Natural resistance-associated macrophage protein n=1 Tax=Acididesulfobacillus acetoxydans TaxID=1561005 RepID=A0A8S0XCF3_9FIRM|nr:Natural resistance-associated macrophage protein [Acididesulfobacillus acetoxydans]CEJ08389.1 Natural resistance-associated macrophage protein [Acididesulfobacillus acetoxydans]